MKPQYGPHQQHLLIEERLDRSEDKLTNVFQSWTSNYPVEGSNMKIIELSKMNVTQ